MPRLLGQMLNVRSEIAHVQQNRLHHDNGNSVVHTDGNASNLRKTGEAGQTLDRFRLMYELLPCQREARDGRTRAYQASKTCESKGNT